MKLDFKVCHLPNDTLQLHPSLHVCMLPRNEMRNASLYSAAAPLHSGFSFLQQLIHIQNYHTSQQQTPSPSVWPPPPSVRVACYYGSMVLDHHWWDQRAVFPCLGGEHVHLHHSSFTFLTVLPCRRCQSFVEFGDISYSVLRHSTYPWLEG